jgi:RNA polymerase sigma-70 factor, ECF subfamily
MYTNDPSDSEDLFQEIVLQLWRSYPRFNGKCKITTWMYRVGLNTAITRLRKSSNTPIIGQLGVEHENFADPDNNAIDIEYQQELQIAINTLNKFDKALVMLYLDEKSYKEMAEIMEISESNVGAKVNRIKKKLKEILNPSYGT